MSCPNRIIGLLCWKVSTDQRRHAGVDWTLDSKLHFWDLVELLDSLRLGWEEHACRRAACS